MKVAIYLRVSTKDGRQDTENQRRQLEQHALEQKWTVVKTYRDTKSGKNDDRPAFQQMMQDAATRKFEAVFFWALDRFSRENTLGTLRHLERLNAMQIKFISYSEKYIDTCGIWRDMVISMLATLANQEHLRMSERTLAGLERAKSQGRLGGRRPLPFDMPRALEMWENGSSYQTIADDQGVSKALVVNKFKPTRELVS